MHGVASTVTEPLRLRRATRLLVRFPRAVPFAIFLIIGVITTFSVLSIEASEHRREQVVMREVAQTLANELVRRSNTTEAYLRSGSALFATTPDVSLAMFQRFANELRLDSNAEGSEGIGWAEVIDRANVAEFQRMVSAEKGTNFQIRRQAGASGQTLAPITFLKPDTRESAAALGYDLYSHEVVSAAMDEAARMVRPTATAKLNLGEEGQTIDNGFLIFMPVFEGPLGARKLKGFVFSPFDAQFFLASAMNRSAHPDMGVRFYDGEVGEQNLLAQHVPAYASGMTMAEQITIGNRPFSVEVESARVGSLSPLSMATLLFGLATASLLMLLARLLTRQAVEDEASLAFFEEQNSIRNSLTRELNHRVKNTLASIVSIISLTRRRTDSLDEFADSLEGRVRALSATHDLLTNSEWGTTPLRSVVEVELAPYAGGDTEVVMDGPEIELAPNDALSLGLAIHELATNAAKYGALSRSGAKVTITWERESDHLARLKWEERGGPEVKAERKRGFGTELIEKIVAHELRHPVDMRFEPEGVSCILRVPLRVSAEFHIRERLARLSD